MQTLLDETEKNIKYIQYKMWLNIFTLALFLLTLVLTLIWYDWKLALILFFALWYANASSYIRTLK